MSGMRSEPAEVWLNGERPGRFVWRGRLYTVLSVTERPARLASAEPEQESPRRAEGAGGAAEADEADEARRRAVTDHEHGHEHGAHRRGPLASGWQCWRVTASPGKNVPADAYRLCHDTAAGRWFLSRDTGQ